MTETLICGPLEKLTHHMEDYMAFDAHLDALKRKHLAMSDAVEQAQRSPSMDGLKVANMKKEKLRLKEEITRLSA